jgi:hypothetical protein
MDRHPRPRPVRPSLAGATTGIGPPSRRPGAAVPRSAADRPGGRGHDGLARSDRHPGAWRREGRRAGAGRTPHDRRDGPVPPQRTRPLPLPEGAVRSCRPARPPARMGPGRRPAAPNESSWPSEGTPDPMKMAGGQIAWLQSCGPQFSELRTGPLQICRNEPRSGVQGTSVLQAAAALRAMRGACRNEPDLGPGGPHRGGQADPGAGAAGNFRAPRRDDRGRARRRRPAGPAGVGTSTDHQNSSRCDERSHDREAVRWCRLARS